MSDCAGRDDAAPSFVHAALTASSRGRARQVYEELLGLAVVRETELGRDATKALFGMDAEATMVVYDVGGTPLEVFVCAERAGPQDRYDHICLSVPRREQLLERAAAIGLVVNRLPRGDREIVFIGDLDGNWLEIKEPQR